MTPGDGMGGKWEAGPGWGTHVHPWLIHVDVWWQLLQYCKVISLRLKQINKKKEKKSGYSEITCWSPHETPNLPAIPVTARVF